MKRIKTEESLNWETGQTEVKEVLVDTTAGEFGDLRMIALFKTRYGIEARTFAVRGNFSITFVPESAAELIEIARRGTTLTRLNGRDVARGKYTTAMAVEDFSQ